MTHYQNKEAKKYLIVMLLCTIAIAVFAEGCLLLFLSKNKAVENEAVLELLAKVTEENPNADIQEYMEILNCKSENEWKEKSGEGDNSNAEEKMLRTKNIVKEALSTYGITENDYYFNRMENTNRPVLFVIPAVVIVGMVLLIFVFFCYLRKRQESLSVLEHYMDRIVAGDYNLELGNNSEDELSNLQNHIYKITLTLREQAARYKKQKIALADSVEDISHQLKTPLTSASILLDNLTEDEDMPLEVRKKFTREVARQVQGMNWLILSMLKLSRLDAGVVEMKQEEFLLYPMLQEAVKNLEVLAELKEVEILLPQNKDLESCVMKGDPTWNREAIQNIIKNGIEHSIEGEKVTIQVDDNQVYTAITIINKGDTISKEAQKQIFERHFSDANGSENSMGIGLPLAKAILEKQNGYLTVVSEHGVTSFVMKYIK